MGSCRTRWCVCSSSGNGWNSEWERERESENNVLTSFSLKVLFLALRLLSFSGAVAPDKTPNRVAAKWERGPLNCPPQAPPFCLRLILSAPTAKLISPNLQSNKQPKSSKSCQDDNPNTNFSKHSGLLDYIIPYTYISERTIFVNFMRLNIL